MSVHKCKFVFTGEKCIKQPQLSHLSIYTDEKDIKYDYKWLCLCGKSIWVKEK